MELGQARAHVPERVRPPTPGPGQVCAHLMGHQPGVDGPGRGHADPGDPRPSLHQLATAHQDADAVEVDQGGVVGQLLRSQLRAQRVGLDDQVRRRVTPGHRRHQRHRLGAQRPDVAPLRAEPSGRLPSHDEGLARVVVEQRPRPDQLGLSLEQPQPAPPVGSRGPGKLELTVAHPTGGDEDLSPGVLDRGLVHRPELGQPRLDLVDDLHGFDQLAAELVGVAEVEPGLVVVDVDVGRPEALHDGAEVAPGRAQVSVLHPEAPAVQVGPPRQHGVVPDHGERVGEVLECGGGVARARVQEAALAAGHPLGTTTEARAGQHIVEPVQRAGEVALLAVYVGGADLDQRRQVDVGLQGGRTGEVATSHPQPARATRGDTSFVELLSGQHPAILAGRGR